tara:strand:- start:23615 stop:24631 length:1017 start_codon:yes stop_codon:yes gene_type:complete
VTGGNGFIATNFIRLALSRGYQVTSIDNLSYAGSIRNHNIFAGNTSYHFIEEDIRNEAIAKLINSSGFDAVLNFAAESHVDRSIHDDTNFISTNIAGTHNLLNICRNMIHNSSLKSNFKFIQISTDEVYGSLDSDEDAFTELSILKPTNPYSASKASADLLCMSYYKTHNFPILITRCTNNYGPYQHPEKLIPLTIYRLRNNKTIPIYGSGNQIRDWIYVADHCEGILRALEKGKVGNVYNFGGNNEIQNKICVEKIIAELKPGSSPDNYIKYVKDRPGHDTRYAINSSKAKKELLWEPQIDFEEGIRRTLGWYTENNKWLDDIVSDNDFKNWEEKHY